MHTFDNNMYARRVRIFSCEDVVCQYCPCDEKILVDNLHLWVEVIYVHDIIL